MMRLDGFEDLYANADLRPQPPKLAVVGGHDRTVLEALRIATDRGWVFPIIFGSEVQIEQLAASLKISLAGMTIRDSGPEATAAMAVAEVRSGAAAALMKGRISTPALMAAVLDPERGLRAGRIISQVVLMEIPRDGRRFLLADTGITVKPDYRKRTQIIGHAMEMARALGLSNPRVALMAATETVNLAMPETVEADEMARRNREGALFPGSVIQGPLSFDLAYAADAGAKKGIGGEVVGAADVMIFPDLLSANLTVKAIMYTSDCLFGGVLRGTSAPVVFMSRADTTEVRLNSLVLTLRVLDHEASSEAS